jgi:hypothetical protein
MPRKGFSQDGGGIQKNKVQGFGKEEIPKVREQQVQEEGLRQEAVCFHKVRHQQEVQEEGFRHCRIEK